MRRGIRVISRQAVSGALERTPPLETWLHPVGPAHVIGHPRRRTRLRYRFGGFRSALVTVQMPAIGALGYPPSADPLGSEAGMPCYGSWARCPCYGGSRARGPYGFTTRGPKRLPVLHARLPPHGRPGSSDGANSARPSNSGRCPTTPRSATRGDASQRRDRGSGA